MLHWVSMYSVVSRFIWSISRSTEIAGPSKDQTLVAQPWYHKTTVLQVVITHPRVSSSLHSELSSLSRLIFITRQPQLKTTIIIRVYIPVVWMVHSPARVRINLIIFTSQILNKTPEVVSYPRLKAEVWYKLRRTVISIVFSYQVSQRRDTCLD